MKFPDVSTRVASIVIEPLIGICTAQRSISLHWAVGSEKRFRRD